MKRKRIWLGILIALAAIILLLVIYDGKATPGIGKCREGICIDISIEEPIPFNQPVPVTITVTTDRDASGLELTFVNYDPTIVIEGNPGIETFIGEHSFEQYIRKIIDTQAGVPLEMTIIVRFTDDGYLDLTAYVRDPERKVEVQTFLYFYMSTSGGTFNLPTPDGGLVPSSTKTPEAPTPTPLPPPTLEPNLGRRLPRLEPAAHSVSEHRAI